MIIYFLLQIRREKHKYISERKEQKEDRAVRCRCYFPGTRSCRWKALEAERTLLLCCGGGALVATENIFKDEGFGAN